MQPGLAHYGVVDFRRSNLIFHVEEVSDYGFDGGSGSKCVLRPSDFWYPGLLGVGVSRTSHVTHLGPIFDLCCG